MAFSSSQCFFILDNRIQTLIHGFNNENEESILLNLGFFYKITKSDYRFGMFGWILFINYAVCNHHVRLLTDISNRRNFICRLFARSKKATRHYLLYLWYLLPLKRCIHHRYPSEKWPTAGAGLGKQEKDQRNDWELSGNKRSQVSLEWEACMKIMKC